MSAVATSKDCAGLSPHCLAGSLPQDGSVPEHTSVRVCCAEGPHAGAQALHADQVQAHEQGMLMIGCCSELSGLAPQFLAEVVHSGCTPPHSRYRSRCEIPHGGVHGLQALHSQLQESAK